MLLDRSSKGGRRRAGGRRRRETILQKKGSGSGRGKGLLRGLLAGAVLLALPVAAVGFAVIGVRSLVTAAFERNPLFELQQYDLHSDGRLTSALIREYGALPDSGNLFALDLSGIRSRIEQVPRVRRATVSRQLPDTLVIRVSERVALAQVEVPGRPFRMAVDAEGHVLGPSSTLPHLPIIEGVREPGIGPGVVIADPMARDALRMLEICDHTLLGERLRIRRVIVGSADQMELRLAGGERVWMPRHRLEQKLRELASILSTIEDLRMARDRSKVEIDMTTEERFPVRGLAAHPPT